MANGEINKWAAGETIEEVLHNGDSLFIRLENGKELQIQWEDGEPILKKINIRLKLRGLGTTAQVNNFGG